MNIIAPLPEAVCFGTSEMRYELYKDDKAKLCKNVEEVIQEMRNYQNTDDLSD